MRILLIIFIIIPVIEMWLLIQVGGLIGALPTIAGVLLTAMIGLALLRRQGLSTVMRVRQRMESGEMPAQEMLEGIVLAISGTLLLTPGFFTDAIGFAGLTPGLRRWAIRHLVARVQVFGSGMQGGSTFQNMGASPMGREHTQKPRSEGHETLEGEFSREDEQP